MWVAVQNPQETRYHGPNQPPTTILEADKMNETLLEYSRTHFHKAHGSPFTIEPLEHLLNYDGLMVFGNQVLSGRADFDNITLQPPTKALLMHL